MIGWLGTSACGDSGADAPAAAGSGAAAGTGGGKATGGGAGSGGSAGSGGGAGSNGGAGSGGGGATGGATSSGGSGGSAGAGAVSGGGGSGGNTGPSAGCGKAGPASGERQLEVAGNTGLFIVSVPAAYDPGRPYPLGFAFHGRNRNHENCQAGDCAGVQAELGDSALLVYMQSLRTPLDNEMGGWEAVEEREGNVAFFEAVLELVQNEYCIDTGRVFAAGTSSGASFANLLGCRLGDRLRAVAPVAGYMPETEGCSAPPAALVVHGIDDPHVTFQSGETARDFYLERSGCTTTTVPDLAALHADIRGSRDAMQEIYGCVDYQGCNAVAPVRWCEHSYGGYDNSTHGWPPVGGQLIREFLDELD